MCKLARFCAFFAHFCPSYAFLCVLSCQKGKKQKFAQNCANMCEKCFNIYATPLSLLCVSPQCRDRSRARSSSCLMEVLLSPPVLPARLQKLVGEFCLGFLFFQGDLEGSLAGILREFFRTHKTKAQNLGAYLRAFLVREVVTRT